MLRATELPIPTSHAIGVIKEYVNNIDSFASVWDFDSIEEYVLWVSWTSYAGEYMIEQLGRNPETPPLFIIEQVIKEVEAAATETNGHVGYFFAFLYDQMMDIYDRFIT